MNNLPVMLTPYQGLNTALGSIGGIARGSFVGVMGFFDDNLKSFLLDLQLSQLMFNKPVMIDEYKKPMVISIVLDGNNDEFATALETRHMQIADSVNGDRELLKLGYSFKVCSVLDKLNHTVESIIDYTSRIEATGDETHLLVIDDLTKISNLDKDGNVRTMREMVRILREHYNPRGTTVITSFEFDEVVKLMKMLNPVEYVSNVITAGLYATDSRLNQELDCEIMVDYTDTAMYLQCGKHRGSLNRDIKVCYKRNNEGYVKFDITGADMSSIITNDLFKPVEPRMFTDDKIYDEPVDNVVARYESIKDGVAEVIGVAETDQYLNMQMGDMVNLLKSNNCRSYMMGVDGKTVTVRMSWDGAIEIIIDHVIMMVGDNQSTGSVLSHITVQSEAVLIEYALGVAVTLSTLESLVKLKSKSGE